MAYPFPIDRLPSFDTIKAEVKPTVMKVADLLPTQYYVRIDRLQWLNEGRKPEGEDLPHVVTYQGKTYLYDGHHRWMLASINGITHLPVRNFIIHDQDDKDQARLSGGIHLAESRHEERPTLACAAGSQDRPDCARHQPV